MMMTARGQNWKLDLNFKADGESESVSNLLIDPLRVGASDEK